jgi:hypothetical protein
MQRISDASEGKREDFPWLFNQSPSHGTDFEIKIRNPSFAKTTAKLVR